MGSSAAISVQNVTKNYVVRRSAGGGPRQVVRAVDGVSLSIARGETLGIVGESGCGKSTLARLIMGLTPLSSGVVESHGVAVTARTMRDFRSRAQMVFQDPYASLDPRHRVRFSVEEPLRVHRRMGAIERRQVAERSFEAVGLSAIMLDRYPHELSGGQRQRVAIARAIIVRPEFLVCDEPVSALDVSVQAQVLNLFVSLKRELNLASLFISHDLAVIRHVSDRVAVMYMGNIVEEAPTADLIDAPQHPYTRALLDAVPRVHAGGAQPVRAVVGDLPDPSAPQRGCPFRSRCPKVQELCSREKPALTATALDRAVACHFPEEVSIRDAVTPPRQKAAVSA